MENKTTFPVKVYRGGEPPRNVNAQFDLDNLLKAGWSLTPYVYRHTLFPVVLYHPVLGNKSVNAQADYDTMLAEGWSTEPGEVSKIDVLRNRLEYHENEIKKIEAELDKLMPPEETKVEVVSEVPKETNEPENQDAGNPPTNLEVTTLPNLKKRGRSRK